MKYDVVIIGSGLGGLLCGVTLSKEGYNVCVVEKNPKLGGSLQSFGRKKCIFNTGMNYTESLDDGQILNRFFRYFGLMDSLKLKRLDADAFEVISFADGTEYPFAMGNEAFIEALASHFPNEREGLKAYTRKVQEVCQSAPLYTLNNNNPYLFANEYLGVGAHEYIASVIKNPRLQQVLAGNNMLYAGIQHKTPLFIHSLINHSFIESSWRLVDGSHQLITALANQITSNGGTILKNSKVTKIITNDQKQVTAVETENGEHIEARYVISNVHPAATFKLTEPNTIRRSHLQRINQLENTMGMFTLYGVLKPGSFPYLNKNYYHFNTDNVWTAGFYDQKQWPQNFLFMTPASSRSSEFADGYSVITYLNYAELSQWENTTVEKRGDEYKAFKQQKAEQLLAAVEKRFNGIQAATEAVYTSTPLTWRDYTGTIDGSAYGILKDYNSPMHSTILPKTKIANLLLTGQNVNLHGILGVTISSILTCGELIDIKQLIGKIKTASE